MISNTGVSLIHRALQVVLLVGTAAGRAARSSDEIENTLVFSGDNQVPPKCIYKHDGPPTKLPRIMYPLYYDLPQYNNVTGACTDEFIKNLSKGCKSILAVVNPGSGPAPVNSKGYNGYQACTRLLDKNGVQMIGYVKTKVAHVLPSGIWKYTGVRNISDIKRDVDSWYDHFGDIPHFKGIFVDETSNYYQIVHNAFRVNNTAIYQEIITYIKQKWKNSLVVLNPGSFTSTKLLTPAPGFPEPADISIPYEDYAKHFIPKNDNCTSVQWSPKMGNFGIGPWCKYVPKWDHVEDFKNGVSNRQFKAATFMHSNEWGIEFAKKAARTAALWNFTYFYSTNLLLADNPWRGLPSYWEEYLDFLHKYAFEKVTGTVGIPPVPLKDNNGNLYPDEIPNRDYGYHDFKCPFNWKSKLHSNFPDMFNCNQYFSCYGDDQFHHLKCDKHMNFNPVSGKCMNRRLYPCIQYSTPKNSPFVCPEDWEDYPNNNYANTRICNKFYTCTHEGAIEYSCPKDWYFDRTTRYCVPKDQTTCVVSSETPMSSYFQSNSLGIHELELTSGNYKIGQFSCPLGWEKSNNKLYVDEKNCKMFYQCGENGFTHTICPNDWLFDHQLLSCVPQDQTDCIEDSKKSVKSTSNEIDPLSNSITDGVGRNSEVHEHFFTCPNNWEDHENKNYPDVYNCDMFYTCGDKITHTKCIGEQNFDPIARYCSKDKVQCTPSEKGSRKLASPTSKPFPIRTTSKDIPAPTATEETNDIYVSTDIKSISFKCPSGWDDDSNRFYSNIYDCRTFYECGDKGESMVTCYGDQRFDPVNRICISPKQVPCYQAL